MLSNKRARLLFFFIRYSGYVIPLPLNERIKVSKTIHPFLLCKQNIRYFYNLEKSLYCIRATMEVLKSIVANEGRVLFVSDLPTLESRFLLDTDLRCTKWKRGSIAKSKDADLVFLSGINEENLVEAYRKCILLVGIGSPTLSKVAYPYNLNISSALLSDWFFGTLYASCMQGKRMVKTKKKSIKSFLGKGKSKTFNNKNEI